MPIALTMRLRPSRPWQQDTRQLHGLACTLFEGREGNHTAQAKRFGVWPVMPDPDDPHAGLVWRCVWLSDDPLPFGVAATSQVRLGAVTCSVVGMDERKASYVELATGAVRDSATLAFRSPTYFSRNGADVVTPVRRGWRGRISTTVRPDPAVGGVAPAAGGAD